MGLLVVLSAAGCQGPTAPDGTASSSLGSTSGVKTDWQELVIGEVVKPPNISVAGPTTKGEPGTAEVPRFTQFMTTQHQDQYCWAACAEMVLRHAGDKDVTQETLVAQFKGEREIKAGNVYELMRAIAPPTAQKSPDLAKARNIEISPGALVKGWAELNGTGSDVLVKEIAAGRPVVAGLLDEPTSKMGHAVVVYRVDFIRLDDMSKVPVVGKAADDFMDAIKKMPLFGANADYALVSFTIADPWTGAPATIPAADFKQRVCFAVSRPMAAEVLSATDSVVKLR